ncbi:DUF1192 domain-containing protein [Sphingorhabdus sp. EL138]|jgi:uncharacterized small protein (DUF1192 family)|uniref:DUF1192 domain-containing protein n=1 Tax=Sphingorhabdus sp. EL138 TaxID=2073156 RepID=UPI000D69DA76|nr:DUF1192 domain-containing protein [Sphingorhabdus sp. EL138]
MNDDDDLPRSANDPLSLLIKQDLDPFSVDELEKRISTLKTEISRCEAKKSFAVSHRASADSLFKKT